MCKRKISKLEEVNCDSKSVKWKNAAKEENESAKVKKIKKYKKLKCV